MPCEVVTGYGEGVAKGDGIDAEVQCSEAVAALRRQQRMGVEAAVRVGHALEGVRLAGAHGRNHRIGRDGDCMQREGQGTVGAKVVRYGVELRAGFGEYTVEPLYGQLVFAKGGVEHSMAVAQHRQVIGDDAVAACGIGLYNGGNRVAINRDAVEITWQAVLAAGVEIGELCAAA